jgi:hypothetical protein
MARVNNVNLNINIDVGNADIRVTYSLIGNSFDIASGQPYREVVKLIGVDNLPEDGTNEDIIGGQIIDTTVVFANASPIPRNWSRTILKSILNEDNPGQDEIRAIVTLTPIPASPANSSSNIVNGFYN